MNYLRAMLDVVVDPVDMLLEDVLKIAVFVVPAIVIIVIVTLISIFTRKHK